MLARAGRLSATLTGVAYIYRENEDNYLNFIKNRHPSGHILLTERSYFEFRMSATNWYTFSVTTE